MATSKKDHDLLIEMRVEISAIRDDIRKLNDNTATTLTDHETRLRFIERYMWLAIGVLTLAEFIIQAVLPLVKH